MAKLNNKEKEWVEMRQRFSLSHAQVQMARELELVPRALAKQPDVPALIEHLYLERFGRNDRARQEQRENAMEKLALKKLGPKPKEPEPPKPAPKPRKKNRPQVSIPRAPRKR